MENIYYNRTLKALRLLRSRGYEPEEIVHNWTFDAENSDEAEQMTLAISKFKTETIDAG